MRKTLILLVVTLFLVFIVGNISAEELTEAQQEVWKTVQDYWEAFIKADIDAMMANSHADSFIWWGTQANPLTKNELILKYKGWFEYDKPESYLLHPLKINIVNDVAINYYYHKWNGLKLSSRGRTISTLVKQDGKWVGLGGLSFSCDKLPICTFY